MELTFEMLIIACPLIFLAGLIDSIAGGGGLISLPAFLLAGLPPHMAIGTNKLSSSIGTTLSTIRLSKHLNLPLAAVSVVCSLLGASLGSRLTLLVREEIIEYLLIPVLLVVAFYVFRKKNLDTTPEMRAPSRSVSFLLAAAISFAIGCYDGFYGPGTGTFLILAFTGLLKLNIRTASANAKAVNLASNIGSVIVFLTNGKVFLALGLIAALFSLAGNYIGSGLVVKNGAKIVRPIIFVVLGILFLRILFF